jgi:hypothetical protein
VDDQVLVVARHSRESGNPVPLLGIEVKKTKSLDSRFRGNDGGEEEMKRER